MAQTDHSGFANGSWIRKNSDEHGVKVDQAEFLRIQLRSTANDSLFYSLRFFAAVCLRVKKMIPQTDLASSFVPERVATVWKFKWFDELCSIFDSSSKS